jgi:hypothetical protein
MSYEKNMPYYHCPGPPCRSGFIRVAREPGKRNKTVIEECHLQQRRGADLFQKLRRMPSPWRVGSDVAS